MLAAWLAAFAMLLQAQGKGYQCEHGYQERCSDGKYHASDGSAQPDTCDNDHFEKDGKTEKPDSHKCHCEVASTDADHCPPGGLKKNYADMPHCDTSCRDEACACVNKCDANDVTPPTPKKKRGK